MINEYFDKIKEAKSSLFESLTMGFFAILIGTTILVGSFTSGYAELYGSMILIGIMLVMVGLILSWSSILTYVKRSIILEHYYRELEKTE